MRRLLRVDRVLMMIKEFSAFAKKKHSSFADKLLMIFKIMLLAEDFTDLTAYLMQMKVMSA